LGCARIRHGGGAFRHLNASALGGELTIQELGSLGELIAAIATVVTLIYLATQIRHNNKALAEATSGQLNASYASINSRISSDAQFAELFIRGRNDIESLDPVELERFRAFVQDVLNVSVYADGLQSSHDVQALHFDAFNVISGLYHTYPGIRAVVDSLEASTPRNLVGRIRMSRGTYTMLERDRADRASESDRKS
jgi:hypothetical protein